MVYVELKHGGRSEVTKKICKTVLVNAAEKLVCLLHYLQVTQIQGTDMATGLISDIQLKKWCGKLSS